MGLWRVFYADWQMECCGTPFSVGDEVTWPLLLDEGGATLGGGWSGALSAITATPEYVRDDGAEIRVLRADDGLVVALRSDPDDDAADTDGGSRSRGRSAGTRTGTGTGTGSGRDGSGPGPGRRVARSGLLTVERHGARWPGTTGTVRTIHLVHQDFAETAPGSRTREPVPASRSSEAVDRSPRWFGEGRAGVLAELYVPGSRT
ncbi:hypothetical protein OG410_13295 [Streptomyces sp. NBC_00659]|uniref:DUF6578 domain-containing protein n=1 Tax=Streptomyces sp. NBC_00659 TaxID=2903669 RepID=UPI002E308A5B|nr:DUF6578 domain-containing protein [Streptomyces sp. NBC_00659]